MSQSRSRGDMVVSEERAKSRFAFISLGCPKNTVDSERMLGQLVQAGHELTASPDGADVVVVNTCGFIEPARQESLSVIREMLDLKRRGRVGSVIVAGCLAERQREMLLDEVPEVDQIVGVFGREEIADVVRRAEQVRRLGRGTDEQRTLFRPAPIRSWEDTARLRITPKHYAYLKISEGCDRTCTFCAIPAMRGKHISKPIDEILKEAQELVDDGVRELIIVAQDTTYYGLDLYGEVRLASLLRQLDSVEGIEWIRILYAYPMYFSDELIEALAGADRIIPYLDMPLQHASDRMLKRMQRRVTRRETEQLLGRLRSAIPDLCLRTTFITGFPGETEADVEELESFVREQRFDRCGVFVYSREPGTPADRLPDHLPEAVKQARRDRIMQVQQEVAFARGLAQVGQEVEAIIDAADPEFPGHVIGRTHADAPEIDGIVRIKAKNLHPGDLIRVKITAADGYDLVGRAVGEPW